MSEDILKDSWMPETPISKKIQARIKKAGQRCPSNDNNSEYRDDGEMETRKEIRSAAPENLLNIAFASLEELEGKNE